MERGEAPDRLVGYHMAMESADEARLHVIRGDNVAYSRPLFPWPRYAVYSGHGDSKNQENFVARQ